MSEWEEPSHIASLTALQNFKCIDDHILKEYSAICILGVVLPWRHQFILAGLCFVIDLLALILYCQTYHVLPMCYFFSLPCNSYIQPQGRDDQDKHTTGWSICRHVPVLNKLRNWRNLRSSKYDIIMKLYSEYDFEI